MDEIYLEELPRNIWLGVSVEDQQRADERVPVLLGVEAAVRFVSAEPLLGPVDLRNVSAGRDQSPDHTNALTGLTCSSHPPEIGPKLHWVIAGGESGPHARPCDLAWLRFLRDQCQRAGTRFFCKQLGAKPYIDHSPQPAASLAAHYGVGPLVAEFLKLRDGKGGVPEEWPYDLRVREYPHV